MRLRVTAAFFSFGLFLPIISTAWSRGAEAPKPLLLADKGKTEYVIALAEDAIPAEQTAANELGNYLKQISGATFTIKNEKDVNDAAPQILIGAGMHVRKLFPSQNWNALGTDGIIIRTRGRNLVLAGGRPRGSLYAVYSFLENSLKVRWWTPAESTVPSQTTVRIGQQDIQYVPQLQSREVFNTNMRDAVFATRLKNNGNHQSQPAEWGGHNTILGWCHTFNQLLPADTYFKEHPEWYSDLGKGDKPATASSVRPGDWQLCLSNEAARKELTKNALQWIRENPGATAISISQNDNKHPCRCEADMALEAKEGSPSGPMLHFVNQVAADIEKEFPNILVETLAYQYTQKPPRFERPRRNVVVRLCSIDADFGRPLDSDSNAVFRDDIKGWKAIAPRLYVWDYVTNFDNFIVPHPNMPVLGANIKFLAANNVVSLFEQGDLYSNGLGDFLALRAWVLSHLMWEPLRDQRQLENEFLNGYYGPAAPHLRAYLDVVQNSFKASGTLEKLDAFQSNYGFLTLDVMNAATRSFRKAKDAVAGDAVLKQRVQEVSYALDHAWLLRYYSLRRDATRDGKPFEGPADPAAAAQAYVEVLQNAKVTRVKESQPLEEFIPTFLDRYKPSGPLPDFVKDKSEYDIIDIQENKFRYGGWGSWVTIEDDSKASNGRAARMPGTTGDWAIQCPIEEDAAFLRNGPWHAYIMARIVPKADAVPGKAMWFGVYDFSKRRDTVDLTLNIADFKTDGGYQAIDLGKVDVTPGMFVWVAGPNRRDVEGVYVDRILLVREPVRAVKN